MLNANFRLGKGASGSWVNQWLCIALISLLCFWTVIYYVTEAAEAFGENVAAANYLYF